MIEGTFWLRAIAFLTLLVCVSGCWRFQEPPAPPGIQNATDHTLNVFLVEDDDADRETPVMELSRGMSNTISPQQVSMCTKEALVARLKDGTEVERRDPGLCEGEVWVVNGDPSD